MNIANLPTQLISLYDRQWADALTQDLGSTLSLNFNAQPNPTASSTSDLNLVVNTINTDSPAIDLTANLTQDLRLTNTDLKSAAQLSPATLALLGINTTTPLQIAAQSQNLTLNLAPDDGPLLDRISSGKLTTQITGFLDIPITQKTPTDANSPPPTFRIANPSLNLTEQTPNAKTNYRADFQSDLVLSPQLRTHILAPIHPILADIRTTENPIRITATGPLIHPPYDDLSRFTGQLRIDIGKVEFQSGSVTLDLLRLFEQTGRAVVPGSIDPIIVNVNHGRLTYEQFNVRFDKFTMRYAGTVNLINRQIKLNTEVPLQALALSFKELEGYVEPIVVPITTRGTIENPRTQIDPEFDLPGLIAEIGIKRGIGEVFGDDADEVGKIINDILKTFGK